MSITQDAPDRALAANGVVDSNNIASMDIQGNIGDASDLQSGGGISIERKATEDDAMARRR